MTETITRYTAPPKGVTRRVDELVPRVDRLVGRLADGQADLVLAVHVEQDKEHAVVFTETEDAIPLLVISDVHTAPREGEDPEYRPIGEDQIRGAGEAGLEVYAHWSDVTDDTAVVQIETSPATPRLRVYLNDATLYDGDVATDGTLGPEHVRVLLDVLDMAKPGWPSQGHHAQHLAAFPHAGDYRTFEDVRADAHAILTRMLRDS